MADAWPGIPYIPVGVVVVLMVQWSIYSMVQMVRQWSLMVQIDIDNDYRRLSGGVWSIWTIGAVYHIL